MSQQVLERFHRALIEEIQTQRPEYLTSPFTVAEIYQNLVPYGSHRDRIGVEMNGDYEDALIRLLAGEGGYLILDSEPALRDLRAELDTANPNTGLYREFAAVDVWLNHAHLDLSAAALDELPDLAEELDTDDPVSMAALAPSENSASGSDLGIVPPGVDIFSDPDAGSATGPDASAATEADESADDASARGSGRPPLSPEFVEEVSDDASGASEEGEVSGAPCRWCQELLPVRTNLNYCPFCGTDLNLVPCRSCGEEIEPGWRYCASCGTEVSD